MEYKDISNQLKAGLSNHRKGWAAISLMCWLRGGEILALILLAVNVHIIFPVAPVLSQWSIWRGDGCEMCLSKAIDGRRLDWCREQEKCILQVIETLRVVSSSGWRKSTYYVIVLKKWRPFLITTIHKVLLFSYYFYHLLQIVMLYKGISYTN